MKTLRKIVFLSLVMIMILPMALILTACGGGANGKLIDLTMSTSKFHSTKTTYYVGDEFCPDDTYVQITFYKKADNKNYELSYPLTKLNKEIEDIKYEVIGFDTSKVATAQEVTIKITSPTYKNELTVSFNINVLPEYIVDSSIADESVVKSNYILNEELNYSKLKIKNTYSNGREELVDVTSEMVTGFDTSTITAKNRKLTITYSDKVFDYYYVVLPSADFELLETDYVKVLVPSAASGYTKSVKNNTYFTYTKDTTSKLDIGCYQEFLHTEYYLKNFYLNTSTLGNSNVNIVSYETKNINGIEANVCKYSYTGSARVYTGVWFDITKVGNSTGSYTVEILYYGNALTESVLNTVMQTITK